MDLGTEKFPLFVTWETRSRWPGGSPRLRGCIGNFEPLPLDAGLREYALISGLKDSRFNPIEEKELSRLQCSVSLLTEFEDAEDYLDWDIGTHGIYITFAAPSSTRRSFRLTSSRLLSATYLPDVIPEQGWTKQEAVDSAIRKAGWDGAIDDEFRYKISLRRYQSMRVIVTWQEYIAWRSDELRRRL
jgi:uncharacterized protein (TIGR00296 family)